MLAFPLTRPKTLFFPEPAAGSFLKRNSFEFVDGFVKLFNNKKLIKRVSFLSCRIGIDGQNVLHFPLIPLNLQLAVKTKIDYLCFYLGFLGFRSPLKTLPPSFYSVGQIADHHKTSLCFSTISVRFFCQSE
ncbi:hypothetical protein [Providencia rettgeri]|uniref:hypothetical protein n=1 Tax=Providencia rettgeri TaxID=587 RepID=UPI001B371066|nr:hypothetical protein [Providencia rettgeri]MBQ0308882.1 hypothetical protein [Providencia rettgeri]